MRTEDYGRRANFYSIHRELALGVVSRREGEVSPASPDVGHVTALR